MTRTLVLHPQSYVGLAVQRKFTENNRIYKGIIQEYYDHKQWWVVKYEDGDEEDWSVAQMKQWVPSFKCGPSIESITENTATALRARIRNRRIRGRPNPLLPAMQELVSIQAGVESGCEFEMPEHCTENLGTVWKLLKIAVEDDGSKWGAYMPADEAAVVDEDDLNNLNLHDLQDSYDVNLAPLDDIETWIKASAILKDSVDNSPNVRRRSPRSKRSVMETRPSR